MPEGDPTERLEIIEHKLDRLLALVDQWRPVLERIAKNPWLGLGKHRG